MDKINRGLKLFKTRHDQVPFLNIFCLEARLPTLSTSRDNHVTLSSFNIFCLEARLAHCPHHVITT